MHVACSLKLTRSAVLILTCSPSLTQSGSFSAFQTASYANRRFASPLLSMGLPPFFISQSTRAPENLKFLSIRSTYPAVKVNSTLVNGVGLTLSCP